MLLQRLCAELALTSRAHGVLLLDEDGGELARAGRCELTQSRTHISLVGRNQGGNTAAPVRPQRAILVILHDERTSPLLVRQRVREARPRFERALDERTARPRGQN